MSRSDRLIRKWDDPILKQVCTPVGDNEDLAELMRQMEYACKKNKGVGLAAPQIGVAKRVMLAITRLRKGTIGTKFYINPEIVSRSAEMDVASEGCLSYPGVFKRIARHTWIDITYQDEPRGERSAPQRVTDFHARILQHEIDHLDGICLVGDDTPPDDVPTELPAAVAVVSRP